jgi:hypothetical protein
MGKKYALVIVFSLTGTLYGCGAVDSRLTYLPEMVRQPASKAAEIEQPPDVSLIVRNNVSAVFTTGSAPRNVKVSFPIPAKYGGWEACVQASVRNVTGRSIGTQTYLVNIENGLIGRRERVDEAHWCAKETYQPL